VRDFQNHLANTMRGSKSNVRHEVDGSGGGPPEANAHPSAAIWPAHSGEPRWPPLLSFVPVIPGWSVVSLLFALSAGSAFGGECPIIVGGQRSLEPVSAQTRLRFIRERLRSDAHRARVWSYTWGAIYSSLTIGQFIAAPLVSHESGLDYYVGGGASLIGLFPLIITPLKVMADDDSLEAMDDVAGPGSCTSLARAEEFLIRDAANEAEGRSLLFHGGNVVVNAGIFFLMGAGFGHWTNATISLLTGIATGEIMILTQPVGALTSLQEYRGGNLAPSTSGPRVALVPLVARKASGVVLVLTF
jgi:hypothetical protein